MHGQAIKILYFSFFAASGLLASVFFTLDAFAQADKGVDVGGWAWNNSLGWLSQRHEITDPESPGQKVGTFGVVKYDKDQAGKEKSGEDFIEGWSWSSLYGFMCWGATCETLCTRDQKGTPACALSSGEKSNLRGSSDPPPTDDKIFTPTATISKKTKNVEGVPIKGEPRTKKLNIVNGWAKILTLKDQGWISLSGCTIALDKNGNCGKGKDYGVYFDPDTQEFRGWAWSSLFGWIAFSGKTLYDTPYSFATKDDERFEVREQAGKILVVTSQGILEFKNVTEAEAQGFKVVLKGNACFTQGLCDKVGFNEKIGKSPWKTQYVGPWVQTKGGTGVQTNVGTTIFSRKGFDLAQSAGFSAEQKFSGEFEQEYEDIGVKKTRKGVRGAVPVTVHCDILTDSEGKEVCSAVGKKRSESELNENPDIRAGALMLEFPKKSKKDKQKLVSSLSTLQKKVFTTLPVVGRKNVYGYAVKKIYDEGGIEQGAKIGMGDTIYLYDASSEANPTPLRIGSEVLRQHLQFYNGVGSRSGAGTIVSYGANIEIYRPLWYEVGAMDDLKKLASIAWIALKDDQNEGGNIIFDDCIPPMLDIDTITIPDFSKERLNAVPLAGLFFAEGEIRTGHGEGKECLKTFAKYPYTTLSSAKVKLLIRAFQGLSALDAPLTVEGIMVATTFFLQRVYGGENQGSELILDTGRAHTNPPPGIADIIRSLPFK